MQHQHKSQQDSFKNANEGTGLIKDSSLHTIKVAHVGCAS